MSLLWTKVLQTLLAAVLTKTVEDAQALTSERQVQMKKTITPKELTDAIGNIRGATMICYPMGLPDYDAVRQILEEREELGSAALEQLDGAQASLWCFSKELQLDKKLSDYHVRPGCQVLIGIEAAKLYGKQLFDKDAAYWN